MKRNLVEESFQKWEEEDAKKMDMGGRIASTMNKLGMTQRELAQKCHITEVSMSRYINNSRMPKGPIVVEIAKALNVSADYLLGLEELPSPHRRKGVWIVESTCFCSECGSEFPFTDFNFCPECGADMRTRSDVNA